MINLKFVNTKNEVEIFETCFKNQLPLLLKGPTGCGKTQLVEYMANKLNKTLVKVSCNEDTNAADLLGRYILKSGETLWQDGPVTQAIRNNSILYLDEIAEAREDVIVALHSLTDQRREVYLDRINETVTALAGFMLVASYNPGYQKGIKELKPSTKQRFVVVSMNYLSLEKEVSLIQERSQVDQSTAKKLAVIGQKIRQRDDLFLKETVSTRLLLNAAQLIKSGINPRQACHVSISEVLSDERDIVETLNEFVDLHI